MSKKCNRNNNIPALSLFLSLSIPQPSLIVSLKKYFPIVTSKRKMNWDKCRLHIHTHTHKETYRHASINTHMNIQTPPQPPTLSNVDNILVFRQKRKKIKWKKETATTCNYVRKNVISWEFSLSPFLSFCFYTHDMNVIVKIYKRKHPVACRLSSSKKYIRDAFSHIVFWIRK
jgi:hypothetical protein